MIRVSASFLAADGSVAEAPFAESEHGGVHAVSFDAEAPFALDAACGVSLTLSFGEDTAAFTAVYRHCEYWCRAAFGTTFDGVPTETQLLIVRHADGRFTTILPVVSETYKCVLAGREDGTLTAKLFTLCEGMSAVKALALVYAESDDPLEDVPRLWQTAFDLLDTGVKLREERRYPEMLEYLGWCSWDAMQIRVNEKELLEKCEEFKEKNIPVKYAIIDDMWADIPAFKTAVYKDFGEMVRMMHMSTLASFEAAQDRFPNGLAHTVSGMKKYLPYVGLWHPTTGYWFGLTEGTALFDKYRGILEQTLAGKWLPKPTYADFYRFFDGFHTFLEDSGADFVKVDNQSSLRVNYAGKRPLGTLAKELHAALEDSVGKHFDLNMINCMGCASENIFNRPASAVSRCSGDFIPENAAWFVRHIKACAFTGVLQGDVLYCDWDMFWSDDAQSVKNSVLRAISGGPVYVSDKLGRSKKDVLMPLCLNDGRILRCDRPAVPTRDCLIGDPETSGKPFKVQNTLKGSGAVAMFDLDAEGNAVSGTLSPSDVHGLKGERFAVYEHFTQSTFVMNLNERMPVTLDGRDDFRLYLFVPIRDDFAVIGRTNKYMSPLTVKNASRERVELAEAGDYLYFRDGAFHTGRA